MLNESWDIIEDSEAALDNCWDAGDAGDIGDTGNAGRVTSVSESDSAYEIRLERSLLSFIFDNLDSAEAFPDEINLPLKRAFGILWTALFVRYKHYSKGKCFDQIPKTLREYN